MNQLYIHIYPLFFRFFSHIAKASSLRSHPQRFYCENLALTMSFELLCTKVIKSFLLPLGLTIANLSLQSANMAISCLSGEPLLWPDTFSLSPAHLYDLTSGIFLIPSPACPDPRCPSKPFLTMANRSELSPLISHNVYFCLTSSTHLFIHASTQVFECLQCAGYGRVFRAENTRSLP